MEDKLKEYAVLSERIAKDEARKDVIKKELEEAFGQREHTERTPFGTFKMVGRTSYEYSDELKAAQEDVKMMMQDEQEQNIAKKTVSYSLRLNR